MPRAEVRYRPAALADLEDIFRIVLRVSASPETARRFVDRIRER
jgi:toxin ParE1/3/4